MNRNDVTDLNVTAGDPHNVLVELCAGGIEDVELARTCGIQRLELNTAMSLGGLTPSPGLVLQARDHFPGKIIAMVRPREGGFCYSEAEFRQMLRDARFMMDHGCDGLATGFLRNDGTVDEVRCQKLRHLFPEACLVFHRAFDVVPDAASALESLVSAGFDRILTSGGHESALAGCKQLCALSEQARQRIEILPGGGIRAENVQQLMQNTGCRQVHTAARRMQSDLSVAASAQIRFSSEPHVGPGDYAACCPQALNQLLDRLKAASGR